MPFAIGFDAGSYALALLKSVADDLEEAVGTGLRRGTGVLPPVALALTSRPTSKAGSWDSSSKSGLPRPKQVKAGSFLFAVDRLQTLFSNGSPTSMVGICFSGFSKIAESGTRQAKAPQ
jgi:hypothetical protein